MRTACRSHFSKMRSTSASRPRLATSSIRSCDSESMISYGVMPVSRCGTSDDVDLDAGAAARSHLGRRAGQPGGAHVLDADERVGLHHLEARLEQQLLHERIADLHRRPLLR